MLVDMSTAGSSPRRKENEMNKTLELARELVRALEEEAENQDKVQLGTMQPGDIIVTNGRRYKILKQMDGQTKIQSVEFMLEGVQFDSDSSDYSTSDLKKRIDSDVLPVFEMDFDAENIVKHEVDLTTVDAQKDFGSCQCKVRPITFDEAREFNALLVNEDLPDWDWTCTAWSTEERGWKYSVAVVSPRGYISRNYYDNGYGVRPVCILKSDIFVSKGE